MNKLDEEKKNILAKALKNSHPKFSQSILGAVVLGISSVERTTKNNLLSIFESEYVGTRVFQKSVCPLFYEPESIFFPAKNIATPPIQ